MIGALNPHAIPLVLVPTSRAAPRTFVVACCGQCGNASDSPRARVCTRTDCGLAARHHHDRSNAA